MYLFCSSFCILEMRMKMLEKLEEISEYQFQDKKLLKQATAQRPVRRCRR